MKLILLIAITAYCNGYPRFKEGAKYRLINDWQGWCRSLAAPELPNGNLSMARIDHIETQFWTISYKKGFINGPAIKIQHGRYAIGLNDDLATIGLFPAENNGDSVYWKLTARGGKWLRLTTLKSETADLGSPDDRESQDVEIRNATRFAFVLTNWRILEIEKIIHGIPPSIGVTGNFFKKYMNMSGFPILASDKPSDAALYRLYFIVQMMLSKIPPADTALLDIGKDQSYMSLIGATEQNCDMPQQEEECTNDTRTIRYWNWRARGMGGKFASCGEENVMCHEKDRWCLEDICIHEFAHQTSYLLYWWTPSFYYDLRDAFANAKEKGLFNNTYAMTNRNEYWAEGVQNWFDVNTHHGRPVQEPPYQKHPYIYTREQMRDYDPYLYQIVAKYMPDEVNSCSCHERKVRTKDKCEWPEGPYWVPDWRP